MLKKFLSAVTAIALVACAGSFAPNVQYIKPLLTTAAEEYTYGILTYEISYSYFKEPESIEITGCDKSAEGEIVIPEEIDGLPVEWINRYAFKECTGLTSIAIPGNVHWIGDYAFEGCTGLTSVTFGNRPPDSNWLYQIGGYAFKGCTELTSITLPEHLEAVPKGAFSDCTSLSSVTFPDDIYGIGDYAFQGCTALTSFTLPPYMSRIGVRSFADCTSLESIELSDRVKTIDMYAFENCNALTSITLPSTVTKLGSYVFKNCSDLTSVNISEGITDISTYMFSDCSSLTSVDFPASITNIGRGAFIGSGLTSVSFADECKNVTIGENAFKETYIEELTINCRSTIGKNAFSNCDSLLKVNLFAPKISSGAFADCDSLLTAELHNANVSKGAFEKCSALKEMKFSGTTVLDQHSVIDCPALENIDFSDCKLTSDYAITKCPKLVNIDSVPAFDSDTGDFTAEKKEFIYDHFNGADDVGFMYQYVTAQVDKVVSEYITDNMSDLQKIVAMHDWVCENTKYTEGNVKDRENHNDASVFMNDYTVCEGYARACNLLYNAAGIETYYVQSIDHAWNIVKLGEQYFHVDATWDDGDTISRNWFLKSDDEFRNEGGSHAKWELFTPSSLHSFQKKTLPECKYKMGDVNYDGCIDASDASDVLQAYAKLSTNQAANIDTVLADYNLDGIIDASDASDILVYYAYQSTH